MRHEGKLLAVIFGMIAIFCVVVFMAPQTTSQKLGLTGQALATTPTPTPTPTPIDLTGDGSPLPTRWAKTGGYAYRTVSPSYFGTGGITAGQKIKLFNLPIATTALDVTVSIDVPSTTTSPLFCIGDSAAHTTYLHGGTLAAGGKATYSSLTSTTATTATTAITVSGKFYGIADEIDLWTSGTLHYGQFTIGVRAIQPAPGPDLPVHPNQGD